MIPDRLVRKFALWPAAFWWGSLTTLGFFVVPMLFARLPSAAMAGNMAANLFGVQTAISVVCALLILLIERAGVRDGAGEGVPLSAAPGFMAIVAGMLLALLVEFGAAPHIQARDNLALWHTAATVMYFLQWLCAGRALFVAACK